MVNGQLVVTLYNCIIFDDTADGSDFTGGIAEITFDPSNQNQALCTSYDIIDDDVVENDESFAATLSVSNMDDSLIVSFDPSYTRVTILDDDGKLRI